MVDNSVQDTGLPAVDQRWIQIQKRTFTGWVNQHLKDRMMKVSDLSTDLEEGIYLINLLEVISSKEVVKGGKYNKKPKIRAQKLENCSWSLKFLKDEGIRLVAIGPEDLVDHNTKLILGLIWTIILRYHIQKGGVNNSAKNDLLRWVQETIPECNVEDFTRSWNDGKAICHLTDALERGTIDLGPVDSNPDALANAILGEDKAEQCLGIPKILDPRDMVAPDCDELSMMTYISYFRDYAEKKKNQMGREKLEKTADPSKCLAFGQGVEGGEQFVPTSFTIQAKNCFGNNLQQGGDKFEVNILAPNKTRVDHEYVDNNNGTYTVRYCPTDFGKHSIAINLNKQNIANSPYTPEITKSTISAHGAGLERAEVFLPAKFSINAAKIFNSVQADPALGKWGIDPSAFNVAIAAPRGVLQPTIEPAGQGNFTVAYTPSDTGRHTINLTYKGKPIANGPYYVSVEKSSVFASGKGVERGEQFIPTEFIINAKALKDNGVPLSSFDFAVNINGPTTERVEPMLSDNGDGTFTVAWTPLDPGRHNINVTIKGQPIGNGPFAVLVDKSTISAAGPGLERGEVLTPADFKIDARVLKANGLPCNLDEFEINITDPKNQKLSPSIKDNRDGTFDVTYNPNELGRHTVSLGYKARKIGQSPYSVPIEKSGVSAYGPGLEKGEQWIPGEFTINAKNLHSKGVKLSPADLHVSVAGPSNSTVSPTIVDNNDGTFSVSYTPVEQGRHKVEVQLKGQQVGSSPFHVPIDPATTDAKLSTASGPGIEPEGVRSEVPTHFEIQARNKVGAPMKRGGDPFKVKVTGPYSSEPEVKIIDNQNGTYRVEYEADVPGPHTVDVTLNGVGIEKNPFKINVTRDPNAPDPLKFEAFGPGLEDGKVNNAEPTTFTVQAYNGRGEKINNGGHKVEAEVFAPNGNECECKLQDNNNGTYTVTYSTIHTGPHTIDVVLRTKKPLYFDHIKNSPFKVNVIPGTDASKSKCFGPGLEDGKVFDTLPATFKIVAKDRDGKDMGKGGDPFLVEVRGPSGPVPVTVVDNKDGTYDVTYQPDVHGDHVVDVNLRGKPVGGGPFKVNVRQGASHEHSAVEEYQFIVRAKTKTGENKKTGGDNVTCKIEGPDGPLDFVNLTDKHDGSYVVTYSIFTTGDYTISVFIDGKNIRGSPWKQCHTITSVN